MDYPPDDDGQLVYGGNGSLTRLVCGGFVLADALPASALRLFPTALCLDAASTGVNRWLEPVFQFLSMEVDNWQPGASAIVAKLADVFVTQVLRTYLAGAEAAGLIRTEALADRAIARAAELLQSHPDRHWSIAGLASEVGMSRTLLATRFRTLVGESPMRYLARLRLSQAAGYLTTTNATLYSIAQRTGYESEASLSKAFKRAFGQAPGEYRRETVSRPIRTAER